MTKLAINSKLAAALSRIADDPTMTRDQKRAALAELLDARAYIDARGPCGCAEVVDAEAGLYGVEIVPAAKAGEISYSVDLLAFDSPFGAGSDFWRALDRAAGAAGLVSVPGSRLVFRVT